MCFNFCGVYILWIYNFRGFRIFTFVVARYSGVEIFVDIQSEFLYHNSIQQLQRFKICWTCCWICLKMSSYRMKNCIRGFHIYWEKGLFAPVKEATEKIRSLLQWREAPKQSALYYAWSCASVRSTCLPAARTMAREQGTSQARLPHKQLLPF